MGFKYFSTKNKNVEQLLNLKVFDRIIDTTGNNKLISYFFKLLNNNGELILVGQPKINTNLNLHNPLKFFSGVKIFASDGGNFEPQKDFKELSKVFNKNIKYVKKLVTEVISLSNINLGIKKIKNGEAIRVIGDPWKK